MVSLAFKCDLSNEMIFIINDLRKLRRKALLRQIDEIGSTMQYLVAEGAIQLSDVNSNEAMILAELRLRLSELEERLKSPSIIFDDEIELYLNLLSESI